MRGSQSMKEMWISAPFLCLDQTDASSIVKNAMENYFKLLAKHTHFEVFRSIESSPGNVQFETHACE